MSTIQEAASKRASRPKGVSSVSVSVHDELGAFDADKFVESFPVLAEATGGIERLREIVLQMAIRGGLVRQVAGDQSASFLLAHARSRLGESRKLRQAEALPSEPHELPVGWVWCQAQQLGVVAPRNDVADRTTVGFVPMPLVPVDYRQQVRFEKRTWGEIKKGYTHVADGDVAVAKINPCFQNKKSCVIRDMPSGVAAGTTELLVLRPVPGVVVPEYLLLFFKSPGFISGGTAQMTGTAGQQRVPADYFAASPISLPPLAEQKRIVARVDQLMALIDELEAKQTRRREVGARFTKASLEALTDAEGPDDFAAAWDRVVARWEVFADGIENVEAVKATILQLALRGRLTQQQPRDEPASKLFGRILRDREIAFKNRVYRRMDASLPLGSDDPIFPIPPTWEWARLGQLCLNVADGPHYSPKYVPEGAGVPFLSARNVTRSGFELESAKYVSHADHQDFCKRTKPEKGDILFVKGGVNGGVAAVNTLDFEFSVWVHLAVLKLVKPHLDPHFIALALKSPHCYRQSKAQTHGIGNLDIGLTRLILITLPLPPLAEQKRIVAKVEQLMKLCDELEAKLRRSEDRASRLVEAVVQEMVA